MKQLLTIILVSLLVVLSNKGHSQSSEYIVLTVEKDQTKSLHGKYIYFWITPVDSLKYNRLQSKLDVSPAYLHANIYTLNNYENCCAGHTTDLLDFTSKDQRIDFSQTYHQTLDTLWNLVERHRRKIQTIKKWANGVKETINIYATPIKGEFCSCLLGGNTAERYIYYGQIYLPYRNFKINEEFWKSSKSRLIYKDYSYLRIQNSDYHTPN